MIPSRMISYDNSPMRAYFDIFDGSVKYFQRNNLEEIRIHWEIADIFAQDGIKDFDQYISPVFSCAGNTWVLELSQKHLVSDELICLEMRSEGDYKKCLIGISEIGLKKTDGTLAKFFPENFFSGVYFIMKRESMLSLHEKNHLGQDSIIISCTVVIEITKNGLPANPSYSLEQVPLQLIKLDALTDSFRNIDDKESCDVVLRIEDTEFRAHKAVLITRSTVFAAMFRHDSFLEEQTSIIDIVDCDSESFRDFLNFLYFGKLGGGISFCNVFHLFVISDRYDVQDLKSFCKEYMVHYLTKDTALDVIELAEKYEEQKLLHAAKYCFNRNQVTFNDILLSIFRIRNALLFLICVISIYTVIYHYDIVIMIFVIVILLMIILKYI